MNEQDLMMNEELKRAAEWASDLAANLGVHECSFCHKEKLIVRTVFKDGPVIGVVDGFAIRRSIPMSLCIDCHIDKYNLTKNLDPKDKSEVRKFILNRMGLESTESIVENFCQS